MNYLILTLCFTIFTCANAVTTTQKYNVDTLLDNVHQFELTEIYNGNMNFLWNIFHNEIGEFLNSPLAIMNINEPNIVINGLTIKNFTKPHFNRAVENLNLNENTVQIQEIIQIDQIILNADSMQVEDILNNKNIQQVLMHVNMLTLNFKVKIEANGIGKCVIRPTIFLLAMEASILSANTDNEVYQNVDILKVVNEKLIRKANTELNWLLHLKYSNLEFGSCRENKYKNIDFYSTNLIE